MSDLNVIVCPDCKREIPINEALSHQIEDRLKSEFIEKSKKLEEVLRQAQDKSEKQEEEFKTKLKESLELKEKEITEKSRKYLLEQKEKLKEELSRETQEKFSLELEDLKKQNEEKEKRIKEAQEMELRFREEKRAFQEKEKNLELEMVRRMDEERMKLSEKLQEDISQKYKVQQLEYEKKLGDMQKALEDAQRKGLASSERFRGEIQELDLEESLRSNFIFDEISEVPKGILGADVIQDVKDNTGRSCGTIIWESKRTKTFNEEWITKLKDDLIRSKGKFAILVTQTLPEDIKCFAWRNGVWVTDFASYLELTMVLRMNLMEIKRLERASEGRDTKTSQVYNYLGSDDFRYKIQSMVETFVMMKDQLEQEKRAFQKQWSTREMQIKRIMEGTVSVIGDLQGIMGSSLPRIEGVDMPGIGL
jgi:hypothetical protein